MKRAFTLIELLVVIAIIAILAAILFPVFAQAKEAAKKTQSLSNAKQGATSLMIYTGDYDDLMPNTNLVDYATGNYQATIVVDVPAEWRSTNAAWVNARNSTHPNNVYPYSKNAEILEAAGQRIESTWASGTPIASRIKAPHKASITMNGFLSSYSQTAINEISRIPLLWYGTGAQRVEGFAFANPRLGCNGPNTSACVFNPSGLPTATSAFGATLGGATFSMALPTPTPAAVHTGGTIYVASDTSARFVRLARPGSTGNLNFTDPYAAYDERGVGTSFYACATSASAPAYSCIFRPDFDYNYDNWF